jgi:hypothetical protein
MPGLVIPCGVSVHAVRVEIGLASEDENPDREGRQTSPPCAGFEDVPDLLEPPEDVAAGAGPSVRKYFKMRGAESNPSVFSGVGKRAKEEKRGYPTHPGHHSIP